MYSHSLIFRPTCSFARCVDKIHGICIFARDPAVFKNCLYKAPKFDVRRCASRECHEFTVAQRKRYRVLIKKVYLRSATSPCFKVLDHVLEMADRRCGPPRVSTKLNNLNYQY